MLVAPAKVEIFWSPNIDNLRKRVLEYLKAHPGYEPRVQFFSIPEASKDGTLKYLKVAFVRLYRTRGEENGSIG